MMSALMCVADQARLALCSFLARESGQDIMEYGLLAGLISISAVVVILLFGPPMIPFFQDVINSFQSS